MFELGFEDWVWVRVMGFGKVMGCLGGFILCFDIIWLYLINYVCMFIYMIVMVFLFLISIEVVYEFMMSGGVELLVYCFKNFVKNVYCLLMEMYERLKFLLYLFCVSLVELKFFIILVFIDYLCSLVGYC